MTREECINRLSEFRNMHRLFIFIIPINEIMLIEPTETGENLSAEDEKAGYNDYLYCQHMVYDENYGEYSELVCDDAPMIFFNNEEKPWNEDIATAVYDVLLDYIGEITLTEEADKIFFPLHGTPNIAY